jgi:ribonuclease P protein component
MLPKINRIRKQKDFEAIFKNSKSFKNNLFIFKIAKNNLGLDRFGFIVSQKVSKKAVLRNNVRRRLAESVKSEINSTFKNSQPREGVDVIFIALSGIEKREFVEIKEAVESVMVKFGLVIKNSKI